MEVVLNIAGAVIDLERAIDLMDEQALANTNAMPPHAWEDGDVQAWFNAYEREHARLYGDWPLSQAAPAYSN